MTQLIKIGNSHGMRIPKPIIEQAHLMNAELKLKVTKNGLLITPIKKPRSHWKDQIAKSIKNNKGVSFDSDWIEADLTNDTHWEW